VKEYMFTKIFWLGTLERAVKTFAQALLLVFVGDNAYNVISVNWPESLALAATGALISVLTSLVSSRIGEKNSPSLVATQEEEAVVEKIEAGEPVGDPPVVVEQPMSLLPSDADRPAPAPAKAVRKRAPRKKAAE
jgi:hypothetical protein